MAAPPLLGNSLLVLALLSQLSSTRLQQVVFGQGPVTFLKDDTCTWWSRERAHEIFGQHAALQQATEKGDVTAASLLYSQGQGLSNQVNHHVAFVVVVVVVVAAERKPLFVNSFRVASFYATWSFLIICSSFRVSCFYFTHLSLSCFYFTHLPAPLLHGQELFVYPAFISLFRVPCFYFTHLPAPLALHGQELRTLFVEAEAGVAGKHELQRVRGRAPLYKEAHQRLRQELTATGEWQPLFTDTFLRAEQARGVTFTPAQLQRIETWNRMQGWMLDSVGNVILRDTSCGLFWWQVDMLVPAAWGGALDGSNAHRLQVLLCPPVCCPPLLPWLTSFFPMPSLIPMLPPLLPG